MRRTAREEEGGVMYSMTSRGGAEERLSSFLKAVKRPRRPFLKGTLEPPVLRGLRDLKTKGKKPSSLNYT